MAVIGELATLVTAKTEPFTKGLKQAGQQAATFSGTLKSKLGGALSGLGRALTSTGGLLAAFGGTAMLTGLVSKSVKMAIAVENMQTSYKVYLKDLNRAKSLLAEIDKYGSATPFNSDELKESGKQLLAFGFAAEEIMPVIRILGEHAAGTAKPMADFVDIMGKVKASGVASMGDINRLADRGVPIFSELSKVMGVASDQVRTLVGNGKVGFDEVWQAMKNVTEEGGLFSGAVAELAETVGGKMTTLSDNIDAIFKEVGKAILEGLNINELTDQLTKLAKDYKTNIVDATKSAVSVIMEVVQRAPEWVRMVQAMYGSLMSSGRRVEQGAQVIMPIPMAVYDFLARGQMPWQSFQARNQEANSYAERYNSAMQQYNFERNSRLSRTRATSGTAEKELEQQTETLDSIYREQAMQNRILQNQYELMRQQNYGYVGSF